MQVQTIWVADHILVSIIPHQHDYYQLMYCQGGTGKIQIGEVCYPAIAGNAYLVFPMQSHAIIQEDRLRLVEVKFTVNDDFLKEELRRLPSEFSIDDVLPLRIAFSEMKREGLSRALYSHESTNAALYLLLLRLVRNTYTPQNAPLNRESQNCLFDVSSEFSSDYSNTDVLLIKIIDYIESNLSEQITLDDLAQLVHLDKSYMISRFKKIWGIPPMQYINHLRIERAKVLLAMTCKKATEIAQEIGFRSIHYFSRYFKEKEGMTPNEYRTLRKKYMLLDMNQEED